MSTVSLADAVSFMAVVWLVLPLTLMLLVPSVRFAVILAGSVIVSIVIKICHALPVWHPCQLRPPGAHDCNLLNSGGDYDGRIGMPSGHMLTTSFVLLSLLATSTNPHWSHSIFVITAITAMGWSRIVRGCHTLAQVLVGIVFGGLLAWVTRWLVDYLEQQRKKTT